MNSFLRGCYPTCVSLCSVGDMGSERDSMTDGDSTVPFDAFFVRRLVKLARCMPQCVGLLTRQHLRHLFLRASLLASVSHPVPHSVHVDALQLVFWVATTKNGAGRECKREYKHWRRLARPDSLALGGLETFLFNAARRIINFG